VDDARSREEPAGAPRVSTQTSDDAHYTAADAREDARGERMNERIHVYAHSSSHRRVRARFIAASTRRIDLVDAFAIV